MRMLSARTSSLLVCSVYASVPDAHAQCTHQFLTRMLSAQNEHLKNRKTDAHAEHARKELKRMLMVLISS
jgi:hypothetical protein